jgi:hypothetical protein
VDDAGFAPGHIFASRYRIVSLLGRGATGEVYRADDLKLGQPVALKLLSVQNVRGGRPTNRLASEVRLARAIAHPNVCRVYDIGEAEGWHYLSMEYVDGETLASVFRRIGRLPNEKAVDIARQLCAGLTAAHDCGVLHRDLKPANIMVDGRGNVRIMDFGLAVPSDEGAAHQTVAGTPAYMAPEQFIGAGVTEQTDIYALGLVLYELFVGRRVFEAHLLEERLRLALSEGVTVHAAGIEPHIVAAINACLKRDPAERPPTAHAIATAITRGDPFATALAAGRVPSPEIVAADTTQGTLSRPVAWLLLIAVTGGSIAIARAHAFSVAPSQLPKPPEVLAERAAQILAETGQTLAPIADRAFWWWSTEADDRIRFTYRDSSTLLMPANLSHVVTADDPAYDPTRMRMVTLDADGTPSTGGAAPQPLSSRRVGGFNTGELLYWTVILIAFVAGGILGRRNLRAGEGDRRGSWRLSILVGCCTALTAILRAHHVPSAADELSSLFVISGLSVLWAAFCWLAYVSFEPYVRRLWPRMLVSWTRVLAGRLLDPLVGRDVLIGACVGVVSAAVVAFIRFEVASNAEPLPQSALDALRSSTAFGGGLLFAFLEALVSSLCGLVLFVFFRLILKSTLIAWVALLVLTVPIFAARATASDLIIAALLDVAGLVVLLRIGLVASIAMLIVWNFLTSFALTVDANAWFFGQSLIVLLLIGAMASYGFFVSLGGRPVLGGLEAG